MKKWDDIIGWDIVSIEEYREEKIKETNVKTETNIDSGISVANDEPKRKQATLPNNLNMPKVENKSCKIITNIGIVSKKTQESHKPKNDKQKKAKEKKKTTIFQVVSDSVKNTIGEIELSYYIGMQPKSSERKETKETKETKEYNQALKIICESNKRDLKKQMELMINLMKLEYEENKRQTEFIKKYDKLQSILECSSDNRRAKMELILVLINEGYKEIAKEEFKEDYSFIDGLIQAYQRRKITKDQVKASIDEFCL